MNISADLSIIIPTFNSEKTIYDSLNSIAEQKLQPFEVLIFDNSSTDTTEKLVNSFQSRIKNLKFISQRDRGIYDAMNKGIKLAKSNWLFFLGSDDQFHDNNVVANVSKVLNTTNNKIVYGNVEIVGKVAWSGNKRIYGGEFDIERIITNNICHQSIFYHTDVFENIGLYDLNYKICADHHLNIKASSKYFFQYVDLIIANFTGGGLSENLDQQFVNDFEYMVAKYHLNKIHKLKLFNHKIQKVADSEFKNHKYLRGFYLYIVLFYKKTLFKVKY